MGAIVLRSDRTLSAAASRFVDLVLEHEFGSMEGATAQGTAEAS